MDSKLLFICLGNICRSPAAEAVMAHLLKQQKLQDKFLLDSAGTYGGHAGENSDPRMRRAAGRRGYAMTHLARPLVREDFRLFDRLIVMDESNYRDVCAMAPEDCRHKIVRMRDYLLRHKASHIPDPYYQGAEGFEHVLDLLEDACQGLLEDLTP